MTAEEIITKVGGVKKVAHELDKTTPAVDQWVRRGIPLKAWGYFLKKGITLSQLYRASEQARADLK